LYVRPVPETVRKSIRTVGTLPKLDPLDLTKLALEKSYRAARKAMFKARENDACAGMSIAGASASRTLWYQLTPAQGQAPKLRTVLQRFE
jgi:hypothetical protein